MKKTTVAYLVLALAVSILVITSLAISMKASLDLLTEKSIFLNVAIRTEGIMLAIIGVSIALPLDHSNRGIRVLQAYLFPVVVCIVSEVVGKYLVEGRPADIDAQITLMRINGLLGGIFGLPIRSWLSRYFVDLPRWVHWVDASRQVFTMVIVIFGVAFLLYI
jgi:hypothetical protein